MLAAFGFVAGVMGVAYLSERRRRRISNRAPGAESCPQDEETVRIYLRRLSDTFGTEKPPYTFKAKEVCPPHYDACITYPEPLHFKCGHVQPIVVAHEYGHWLLKKRGSPLYADEEVVESFADLTLKLMSKRGEGCAGLVKISGMASPLCWPGGKVKLKKRLLERIPPHEVYVEPFVGAGHVYWAKEPADLEVINDLDGQLMDFYRFLQSSPGLDCDMTPAMERWEKLRKRYRSGEKLPPCDYLYLVKYGYGCKSRPDKVSPNPGKMEKCRKAQDPSECMIQNVKANLEAYRDRLQNTRILSEDYKGVIQRYDSPETFYYLDPPYTRQQEKPATCSYVSCDVSPEELAKVLEGVRGKWLLTYDDHPRVKEAFKGHRIEVVGTRYELQRSSTPQRTWKPVKNLIIRNYD